MFRVVGMCLFLAGLIAVGESRFNVVFVIVDDLRPVISGYGDVLAKTPNIDKFMRESFHFDRAYSQQALCAPSRNSLLTGRRPDTLRLYDFYNYWRAFVGNFTTLPQYFKEQGYTTYSVGKVFHPGISSNFTDDYPLSWSRPAFHPMSEKFMNSPVCLDGSGVLKKNLICPVLLDSQPLKTLPDIESVQEAKRFLEQEKGKDPFFLALGFHKPHINFRFPKEFLEEFRLEDFQNYTEDSYKPHGMPNVAWNPFTDVRSRDDFKNRNISFPYGPIPSSQRSAIRQAYYATVAYVDDLFGKFLVSVNHSNTVVVLAGDHGWSLGEHAEWAKYSNFEVAVRVPLIIRTPEFALSRSRRIRSIAELVDIFPTLVDLAKLPPVPACQNSSQLLCTEGKSLYPHFVNPGHTDLKPRALSQYPRPGWEPTKNPNSDKPRLRNIKVMGYSMRTENFRYTLWVRFHPENFTRDWTQIYGEEMYDHRIDSGELINLIDRGELNGIRMWLRHRLMNAFSK